MRGRQAVADDVDGLPAGGLVLTSVCPSYFLAAVFLRAALRSDTAFSSAAVIGRRVGRGVGAGDGRVDGDDGGGARGEPIGSRAPPAGSRLPFKADAMWIGADQRSA